MNKLDYDISYEVQLLIKETELCAGCLNQGLTVLRRASFQNKRDYYQSFFLLSIGIERLLKIIVITISRIDKEQLPTNYELKKYGHNIAELFEKVTKELEPNSNFLCSDDLYGQLLDFITNFASGNRYYNLDRLSGVKKNFDPLVQWNKIQQIIKKRHCKETKKNSFSSEERHFYFLRDENNKLIHEEENYFEKFMHLDVIQGYSVYYFYSLISYTVTLLERKSTQKQQLPFYREFFVLFLSNMKVREIIKKKDWKRI